MTVTAELIEQVLQDPARGRRRVWRDAAGQPVRVALADGTVLTIERDDAAGTLGVAEQSGRPLLTLSAPVAIPALVRSLGLNPAQAAGIDGVHRLTATDPGGTTRTEVRERTLRVERGGAVLRIDADDTGRPRRVTAPGCADLLYRWSDGGWTISRLGGPELLRIDETPGRTVFRAGPRCWAESVTDAGSQWSHGSGEPIVTTELDLAGRVTGRQWTGGRRLEYRRDGEGRLAGWTATGGGAGPTVHSRQYAGAELAAVLTGGARTVVRSDAGGRVRKLIGPHGTIAFDYDANGRRTSRRAGRGPAADVTTYRYDPLGQLTAVVTAQRVVEYGWDALGRRVSVTINGVGHLEHRDTTGRLWSVTRSDGEPVCSFIWWNDRVVARCDAAGAIDECYLTDPFGTLLGAASASGGGGFTEAIQPPFGRVEMGAGWRPTLFGHIADGAAPIIPFGARDLDPETGCFLTPDPWHGDPDDPRRLAGQPASALPVETPSAGVHAYALSQHDPLSRPDLDGHFGVFNFILTLFLGPTWGAALTSLSIFLFTPLNLYMEVIGLLGFLGGRHFWPQHSIFGLRGVSGSARLGTMALALNGFFPRAMAGVGADRCITIGHVVWESRHYFRMLDRSRVLELDDIGGTPGADGRPTFDGRRFSDTAQGSILAVTSTDTDRRTWVHASWWTRGPGNAVGVRGADQSFEDRVRPGGGPARGTVYLAQPMPRVMPSPQSAGDSGTLRVVQYMVAGRQASNAELVPDVWFAFDVATTLGLAANDVLRVSAGNVAAGYGAVLTVVAGTSPVAILDHELPTRFRTPPSLRKSITLQKMTAAAATSAGWTFRAGTTDNKKLELAAPGHPVAVGDVFRAAPTTPDPATPERPATFTGVEKVSLALTVSPTLGGANVAGSTLYPLAPDGRAASGTYPDPAATPALVTFPGTQPFGVDDLVQVTAGATTRYGRVTTVAAAVPPGPPGAGGAAGTPGVPASITLDEPLTGMPVGAVRVARLKETDRDTDQGAGAAQAGDVLTIEVASTALFAASQPVLIDGAPRRVRQISAIGTVGVDTVDELVGTGPFTFTKFTTSGTTISSKLSAARFVRHTGGHQPATYGDWPAAVMGLVPTAGPGSYNAERQPSGWRYFLKASPPPADMHPDFHDYWQPVTVAGNSYWLLSSELKIAEDGGAFTWEPDAEDDHPRRHKQQITPNALGAFPLTVRGFVTTPVARPDAGGGKVFAFPAEVQVPEEPSARWTLADSLADHELVHTLQNTYWGPLLGALPLQGAFRTVRDILVANDIDRDDVAWMNYHPINAAGASGFRDSNLFEIASIGGLMQIIWSFVILAPALPDEDARRAILSTNFDEWSSVFNPVNQLIIDAIPKVQNDVPESKDWTVVLGRALTRALDLKAWTPFMGFIKLLLPDGPRNFLEQQASRKSGDLYSTILTVDDKFNATLAVAPNKTAANVTAQLGDAVRLMSFYDGALSRNLAMDACDAPGSHLTTFNELFGSGRAAAILQFSPAADALLPADLYEHVSGTAPTPLQVDGPAPAGGGAAPVTRLLRVPAGTVMRPRLRAIAPIPPRVWRALGCYLVPAGPAVWSATAPDIFTYAAADDAHTAAARVTIASAVLLGSDAVAWAEPAVTGAGPVGPGIARFITEKQALTVTGLNTGRWQAAAGAGITLTPRAGGNGWDLTVDKPAAGVALPTDVRVRIWAPVRPTDDALFDLKHPDVPTLAGKVSYLDDEFWVPVRDFLITVTDLPTLPVGGAAATMTANGTFDLDLPIALAGPASIVPAGALLSVRRTKALPPRGEQWRLSVAGDKFLEAARVVPVVVRFGPGVERPFDITVNPNFTLDAPGFTVTPAAPLPLTITGGTAPFTVVSQPPAATRATAAVSGTTVTVTIAAAAPVPPGAPAPPAAAPVSWRLRVRDSTGAIGVRTLTLQP